jgi:predicted transcriptional regulator
MCYLAREELTMKGKRSTFTFQIDTEVRAALDQIAAGKEWTTGHLVNSVLTDYVSREGKPAKSRRAAEKTAGAS